MTQSPEYPDLTFIQPRAWGSGRDGRSVQYVVIHYTAGSERTTSAEDGAAYDQRRTDGTSCHYFHDQDSTVQCVTTPNRANSALYRGNRLGIQHELCGTLQTREQWLDPASDATIWRAARQVARDCRKYGIPVRRLTVAETRAAWYGSTKPKGIVGHVDVTLAYPEDGGDHTDPGNAFPWDVLLERVAGYVEHGDGWNGQTISMMGDEMGILVKLLPGSPEARTWHADGTWRYPLTAAQVAGKQQLHNAGLLNLGNGGQVYTIQGTDPTLLDAWGLDQTQIGGGSGGGVPLTDAQTEDACFRAVQRAENS